MFSSIHEKDKSLFFVQCTSCEVHTKSNCKTVAVLSYCPSFCKINHSARFSCVILGQAQVGMFQLPYSKLLLFDKNAFSMEGSYEPGKALPKEKKYCGCSHRHSIGFNII